MSDTRDPQGVIAAAEQAANAGDFPAAERLLLEAANLQEASLGSAHPDLANTYNNLGVVYEITGKPQDAELSFRRAYKIATVAFPAHHPFVATSRKNLEDFCAARGIVVDPPTPAPTAAPLPAQPAPPPAPPAAGTARTPAPPPKAATPAAKPVQAPPPAQTRPAIPAQTRPAIPAQTRPAIPAQTRPAIPAPPPSRPSRPTPDARDDDEDDIEEPARGIARIAVAAFVVLLAVVAIGLWYRSRDVEPPAATQQGAPQGPAPSSTPATTPPPPAAPAAIPADQPAPRAAAPPKAQPASREAPSATSTSGLTVVEASVCRNLVTSGNWRCAPLISPADAGPLVFYTRIKSDRNTRVQHRWYRGNQLRRSSDLAIAANPGSGYRTFSRFTVSGAGEWRVELRSADGKLLREEHFTVR